MEKTFIEYKKIKRGFLTKNIKFKKLRDDILSSARETFGAEYINWLLTKNPVKILSRKMKYIISRVLCKN